MSSQDYSPLIDAASTIQTSSYFIFVTLAFLVYDWLIHLDEEIHCFWSVPNGRKFNAARLLYAMSRYVPIVQAGLSAQTIFPISNIGCQLNGYLILAASILYTLTPASFSAIRIYALWPSNLAKALAVTTFLLLFVPGLCIAVINAMAKLAVLPNPFNCGPAHPVLSPVAATRVSVAARICYVIGDLLVLFITWRKTYTTYRAQIKLRQGPSLLRVMLYNGSVYSLVMTTLNVFDIILDLTPLGVTVNNFTTVVTDPLNAVLICRFIFDLHQTNMAATTASSTSAVTSLNFTAGARTSHGTLPAFIASMGSQVPVPGALRFADSEDEGIAQAQSTWERGFYEEEIPQGDEESGRTSGLQGA